AHVGVPRLLLGLLHGDPRRATVRDARPLGRGRPRRSAPGGRFLPDTAAGRVERYVHARHDRGRPTATPEQGRTAPGPGDHRCGRGGLPRADARLSSLSGPLTPAAGPWPRGWARAGWTAGACATPRTRVSRRS